MCFCACHKNIHIKMQKKASLTKFMELKMNIFFLNETVRYIANIVLFSSF